MIYMTFKETMIYHYASLNTIFTKIVKRVRAPNVIQASFVQMDAVSIVFGLARVEQFSRDWVSVRVHELATLFLSIHQSCVKMITIISVYWHARIVRKYTSRILLCR